MDNLIEMTKGDYMLLELSLENNEKFEPQDQIFFTVRDYPSAVNILIEKKELVTENKDTIQFEIWPEDTNNLSIRDYAYDVEIRKPGGSEEHPLKPITVIKNSVFRIGKEVTHADQQI